MQSFNIQEIISELTLEEKASLCSGADFWHTKEVSRLKIPNVMVSDGPHGLRKQEILSGQVAFGQSIKAVCFPSATALACSFDEDLLYTLGCALGEECQAEEISTLLGPGVNMKRSPLCGRNFEYFSEDPYLAGKLAASHVKGVQSKNIGTSVKHFAANNQETLRTSISVDVDERTLREIYLSAFEIIVKEAKPWTIMCSYNCINGVYSCENDWLLNQVLRKEWGFEGLVMTDWGAMNDRVKAIKAGLDLEMPSCMGITDQYLVDAVKNGTLSMEILDVTVERILTLVQNYYSHKQENASYDLDEHHKLAKKIASECAVLLKNDNVLPIKASTKVAFIGEFAKKPRYQGGGSSHINSFKVSSAIESAQAYHVSYAQGYETSKEEVNEELLEEAIQKAKEAEVAVIFAGLPDFKESEGYDRTDLNLPLCQNKLIDEVTRVQPNTIVVLHNGSPVLFPWVDKVKGILEVYLAGQAVGEATVDLLFGNANPCGKLAETFPLRLQDTPSYLNFPGSYRDVSYREGVYIGYRYYDAKEMEVLYPFGYGLSYTSFDYSDLKLEVIDQEVCANKMDKLKIKDTDTIKVTLKVKNTGTVFGKEIVQLYVSDQEASIQRPIKELKGFKKVALEPGQETTVSFVLDQRSFAYYSLELHSWYVESGLYQIHIAKSSRDIVLTGEIEVESSIKPPLIMDDRTTFADLLSHMKDPSQFYHIIESFVANTSEEEDTTGEARMFMEMMKNLPIHSARSFAEVGIPMKTIEEMIQ